MILVVDVGNTHTVLGIRETDGWANRLRLQTRPGMTADEMWGQWTNLLGADLHALNGLLVASVVPDVSTAIEDLGHRYLSEPPRFLAPPWEEAPVEVATENPEAVGADRVAGATAFYRRFGAGIVVDFGTATTLDVIDGNARYRGGVILPGLGASAAGLHTKTALLPLISPRRVPEFNCSTTRESLESGLFYGLTGAVEYLIQRLREKFDLDGEHPVVATGGAAQQFRELTDRIDEVRPDLVLEGLVDCLGSEDPQRWV